MFHSCSFAMKKLNSVLLCVLAGLVSSTAVASPEVQAVASMYDIKAETYRFVRLQREVLATASDPILSKKLRGQLKDSTQGLMRGVQSSQSGLTKLGLQKQHQQMSDTVSAYLADWAAAAGSGNVDLAVLRAKRLALLKLADDISRQAQQKVGGSARQTALIGTGKTVVQELAYDYEFCDPNCAEMLSGDWSDVQKSMDDMRGAASKHFKSSSFDLAQNQLTLLKSAINSRMSKGLNPSDQKQVIGVSDNLWTVMSDALNSSVDAN